MVISDRDCRTAQTQLQTRAYAITMLPGPPVARALPVAMKTPLPMLEPREMIWRVCGVSMSQQPPDTSRSQSYVDLARGDGTVELSVPVIRVHFALSNTTGRL